MNLQRMWRPSSANVADVGLVLALITGFVKEAKVKR